jgi:hypothetical protein
VVLKSILLSVLLTLTTAAQDTAPTSEQILQHAMEVARAHVERLETSVPNFICNEQIVSQFFMADKLKKETKAQSVLTTTRSMSEGRGIFTETRAEMRINGKLTKKNEISGPFVWQGGPAYGDLHVLFNSELGAICLDHKLGGRVRLDGKDALMIETHAPDTIENDQDCSAFHSDSADKIWLEPKTLNVIRVESHDPPATRIPGADLTLTVDYAPVSFDGQEYWLPSHFISRLDFPGTPRHLQYEAFFSEYHKFGAESSFHIDPQP